MTYSKRIVKLFNEDEMPSWLGVGENDRDRQLPKMDSTGK